jgi:hypothetical protein
MGFGSIIGVTGFLQIITTIDYKAISNSHTLQFTTAHSNSSVSLLSATLYGSHM